MIVETEISLVGSTGSIGTQALDVVRASEGALQVVALGANRSFELLAQQADEFRPRVVAIGDPAVAARLKEMLPPEVELRAGLGALESLAQVGDVVLNSVVGFAGLSVTIDALSSGRRLALANKESLIAGAPVVQAARRNRGAEIVPVDSEHCAIHQCLGERRHVTAGSLAVDSSSRQVTPGRAEDVTRLVVTASGGPFRGKSAKELADVSIEDALAHPTWRMGRKITIDSSTLMNKGLEVIEAHELFGIEYDHIDVVVHPQSIVHSMVEFCDGATIAQLSYPDMRLPIGYALCYPQRFGSPYGSLDWTQLSRLDFDVPDLATFRCLSLAYAAGRLGRSAPACLNAANEIAVEAFFAKRIGWLEIPAVVEETLDKVELVDLTRVEDVLEADAVSRLVATRAIEERERGVELSRTEIAPVLDDTPKKHAMSSNTASLVRLLGVIALIVVVAIVAHGFAVLAVILALIVMVMGHEFGHFAVAKLSGMKVTEFFLGFGPRLWSVRRGETEYGIKALPAGGYVRIVGMTMLETIDPVDEPRSFREATFPRRFGVAVAGSAMHFIMAFVLLWAMFTFSGGPVADAVPQITGFSSFANVNSPAQAAGLKAGDQIVSIDGHRFSSGQSYIDYVRARPDQRLQILVTRAGTERKFFVTTINEQEARFANGTKVTDSKTPVGMIGVGLQLIPRYQTTNPITAVGRATTWLGSLTRDSGVEIGQVFSLSGLRSIAHQVATAAKPTPAGASSGASGNTGGLISIYGAVLIGAQAARQNISELLLILVSINIFVGMINLFPMLPLDGGHVVIAVYERLRSTRRRRYHADVAKLMPFTYAFLAGIVLLGLSALYLNILHPPSLPGG